jgi:phage terminase large subunit
MRQSEEDTIPINYSEIWSTQQESDWLNQAAAEAWKTAQAEIEKEQAQQAANKALIDRIVPSSFNDAYLPHLNNNSLTQIYYGGTGSGKSVFVAQRAVYDVMNGGRNYLICRAVAKHSRRSTFQEIQRVITAWGVQSLFNINKTEMTITCENGYQILFTGLDDLENLKSIVPKVGVVTDVWIEEATQTEQAAIKELTRRMRGGDESTAKRLTMTFNPIYQTHWIYLEYFARIAWADDQTVYTSPELSILKTTYKDNRFLTQADRDKIEGETDEYNRNVYTLGNWGVLGDVIFKNWRVQDLSGMQAQFTNHRIGLDFGFSSDPAALAVTHYDRTHQTIYIYGELYERGLTNDVLADEVKKLIGNEYVKCDSAEPKSITELNMYGIRALAVMKGKDSVVFGVQWLQQQTIIIDTRCLNARQELSIYHWRKDKDGNAIRQPIDKNNHLIDALRYAYDDEYMRADSMVAFGG